MSQIIVKYWLYFKLNTFFFGLPGDKLLRVECWGWQDVLAFMLSTRAETLIEKQQTGEGR